MPLTLAQARVHLGHAKRLGIASILVDEARTIGIPPSVAFGICSRETLCGAAIERTGWAGDGGHGRGVMQVDDRYHKTFVRTYANNNHRANIRYALQKVLAVDLKTFGGSLRQALAAYNSGAGNVRKAIRAGLDPDAYTTGRDYGRDVLHRATLFKQLGVDAPSPAALATVALVLATVVIGF